MHFRRVYSTCSKFLIEKNSGFIIKNEIKFTFHNLGIELCDTEIDKIVEKVDFNGRKMISFDEFKHIFSFIKYVIYLM
jgi:Ca2+-binding EF-hand superfamily protein